MNRPFAPAQARPLPRGPEHYWTLMQQAGARGFLVHELVGQCNSRAYGTLSSYVVTLRTMGVLQEIGREPARQPGAEDAVRYAVVKPLRSAPGDPTRHLHRPARPVQEQLWTAMRALPQFTVREIAIVSSTEEVPVQPMVASKYVKRLFRAGLLTAVTRPAKGAPGMVGPVAGVYRLKPGFNRGPRPPAVIGGRIYDFNVSRFVGEPIDGRADDGSEEAA